MTAILKNFIFVLKRFKTSAVLNIMGLSVAFAVFTVIMLQSIYDLSYNRNFKNSKEIYFFSQYWENFEKRIPATSWQLAKDIDDRFPEVQMHCLTREAESDFELRTKSGKNPVSFSYTKVTKSFVDIFTPEVIKGNIEHVFKDENNVLITESIAQLLFGSEDPIGKNFWIENSETCLTVEAVCKDFPLNCSLKNGAYSLLTPSDKANQHNYNAYFLIDPKLLPSLLEKLDNDDFLSKHESLKAIELTNLRDVHFHIPEESDGNFTTTISLLFIGIITLLIAFINYINFFIAIIPVKIRNMNIRKILGANSTSLKLIIASEAVCFTLISFVISLFFVAFFKTTALKEFFSADLSLSANISSLIIIVLIGIIVSFLLGIYSASYVNTFQPAKVLNGSFAYSSTNSKLRNILITIQFSVAIILIIVSVFIKLQHDYMVNYSWGIQKENIVYIKVSDKDNLDFNSFVNELKKNPEITDYTASGCVPGKLNVTQGDSIAGKYATFRSWPVIHNFLDFFGVEVAAGRNFSELDNGESRIIVNETFMKEYEFDDILEQEFYYEEYKGGKVVGVSKDVNFESLQMPIVPMGFTTQNVSFRNYYIFIKIPGNNITQTISFIKETRSRFTDRPFELFFLDDTLNDLYKNENNLAKLIFVFGIIAVIIAMMGVYGLIVFNAKYKAKEIAIRKVNGSTIKEIMLMLNKNMLIQFLIAFLVAVPTAYFVVHKWLESFAYKVPIYWQVFLLSGILILIVAIITVSIQSYRAAVANPTEALNKE